jgi:hypothetical protein
MKVLIGLILIAAIVGLPALYFLMRRRRAAGRGLNTPREGGLRSRLRQFSENRANSGGGRPAVNEFWGRVQRFLDEEWNDGSLPPTTNEEVPMNDIYEFTDGTVFRFSFERSGANWRIYILDQPDYGSRSTDPNTIHRLQDNGRRYYICWNTPLRDLPDARNVAESWAKRTLRYIWYGTGFKVPLED